MERLRQIEEQTMKAQRGIIISSFHLLLQLPCITVLHVHQSTNAPSNKTDAARGDSELYI